MSCIFTKFDMAVTIGIGPFRNVVMIMFNVLEVSIKQIKITIIETPNTRFIFSETVAALTSAFCRTISKMSNELSVPFGFG
jgi:uncharacterized ubiquitin-like protein YukD